MRLPHHAAARWVLALALIPGVAHAQQRDVIRGRATTDSGRAIPLADIIVTVAPSARSITGKSDSTGAFRIVIDEPTGEYLLYVGAVGRRPFRQRITLKSPDSSAVVTARLAPAVATIAAVRVQAKHPRPPQTLGTDARPGTEGGDRTFDGVAGLLPPDQQGDLTAMASAIPGLSSIGGGISAFGLPAEANSTVLNGLAFSGSDLPRDARTLTRFRTSTWDPTVGGFSGAQTAIALAPGGNVTTRRGHVTIDAPALQLTDATAARTGQRYTNVAVDEGGVGALALDKWFYNIGLHVARQTTAVQSLLTASPDALLHAGVAADSASRALALARSLGIPLNEYGAPTARTTSTISFLERIDRAQDPSTGSAAPGPGLAVTGYGKYTRAEALALSPTAAPDAAGRTTSTLAGLQGLYTRYFGADGDYVSETTSGLSFNISHGAPYAQTPGATLRMASDAGLGALTVGGSSALSTDMRGWTWETVNQTGFLLGGNETLPMKVYVQSRFDGYNQAPSTNRLGRYTYASLADLARNDPSSFTRTLRTPRQTGGEWTGAGAVGGSWVRSMLTVTGGVRVDANAFTAEPRYNADVDRLFGVRTDRAPDGMAVSPRLGFVWRYTPTVGYLSLNGSGENVYRGYAQIRGGIGKFRGTLAPTLLADASTLTGLPEGTAQLLCVGAAVPTPDWRGFAADPGSVPNACAGGASSFADTARSVATIARGYEPSESWRGSLGWTHSSILDSYLSVDATYSRTAHRSGTVDLNFSGTPRFFLASEGNRPVFVAPTSIVAATGELGPAGARAVAAFGRVTERVSDLRGDARQVTATVMPNLPLTAGVLIFSYAYLDARGQARGFDGSTAGDPRLIVWAPSSLTSRHTLMAQWAYFFAPAHAIVTAAFRAYSGVPFTPLVATDVNGDGVANDQAFVFDPATASDPRIAAGMRALLNGGSTSARDCLRAQLGRVAARGSCVGPWGNTMNANVGFAQIPHLDRRTRVYLYLANVTSGLDQLLHGSANLRGWGAFPVPQATLLQPRAFDPTTQQFRYDVNPRFGAASPATTLSRAPFRVTLDVEFGLGATSEGQRVEQTMRMRPSLVGTRAPADSIKARYLRTAGTDIYAQLIRLSDSLALSRAQLDAFRAEQLVLRGKADSIYTGLAAFLAAQPTKFNTAKAAQLVSDTRDSLWVVIRAERPFVLSVLTAGQLRLLPEIGLRAMLMDPNNRSLFFSGGW